MSEQNTYTYTDDEETDEGDTSAASSCALLPRLLYCGNELFNTFRQNSEALVQHVEVLNRNLQDAIAAPDNRCKRITLERSRDTLEFTTEKLLRAEPVVGTRYRAAEVLEAMTATITETDESLKQQRKDMAAEPAAVVLIDETRAALEQTCRNLELKAAKLREGCPCAELLAIEQDSNNSMERPQTSISPRCSTCTCLEGQAGELIDKLKKAMCTTIEVTHNFAKEMACRLQANETIHDATDLVMKHAEAIQKKVCDTFTTK